MYADPMLMTNAAQWHQPGMMLDHHWGYDGSPPNRQHYPQPAPRASAPHSNFLPGLGMPHLQPNQRNEYPGAGWNNQQMLHFPPQPLGFASPTAQYLPQAKQQQYQYGGHLHYTGPPMVGGMLAMDYSYPTTPITPLTQTDRVIQPPQHLAPASPKLSRRGPPRKPKRSGHAVWVGNIPVGSSIEALKDHFSRSGTDDIESVFLMAKSNCAFVNYRSKGACEAAVDCFNHSVFGSVRLLCRMRRDTQPREQSKSPLSDGSLSDRNDSVVHSSGQSSTDSLASELNGLGIKYAEQEETKLEHKEEIQPEPEQPLILSSTEKSDTRYFILKSLTKEDLNDSLQKGTWETQAHNQQHLHEAFKDAKTVYLFFSVNQSGEYFGYARMIGSPFDVDATKRPSSRDSQEHVEGLRIVRTPATATAPMGRITDDAARGTLFWEAERPGRFGGAAAASSSTPSSSMSSSADTSESDLGDTSRCRPFRIEWKSVRRVTFQRTKGMKNAWNSGKDVKVARDGTELETGIGERILGLFHEKVGE